MRRNTYWVALLTAVVVVLAGGCGFLRGEREEVAPDVALPVPTFTPWPATAPAMVSVPGDEPNREFVQLVEEDADLFNPVLTNSETGITTLRFIYPRLVGQNAQNGVITPTEMASGWENSVDNRVYTFTLRSDVTWSDGQPVTSADFRYTYEALGEAPVSSPAGDRLDAIAAIDTPDPYTIVLRLTEADCSVLQRLGLPWLPSHRYSADYADLASNPLNERPEVSAGPFRFVEWAPGERIILERNPIYWKGAPHITRYMLHVQPDAKERLRTMAAGGADLLHLAEDELSAARELPIRMYEHPALAVHFLAFNLADPQKPQPGRDEDGNLVVQEPHPVIGDLAVRRAIASGIDTTPLRTEAFGVDGYAPVGAIHPSVTWANAALAPLSYVPAEAAAMLENAGWVDADGDGVREKDGVRLVLSLLTNEENHARVQAADLIAVQLGTLGFEITSVTVPFEETAAMVLDQRYDLALLGWDNLPADPGLQPLWSSDDDAPGYGVNFTSFQDSEVDGWLMEAHTLPGCELQQRGELYRQVQQRVVDVLPYLPLHGEMEGWAVSPRWDGIAPGPWGPAENVHEWQPAE